MESPEPLQTPIVESIPTPPPSTGMSGTTKTILIVLAVLLVLSLCCCLAIFLAGYLVYRGVNGSPSLQNMLDQITTMLPALLALI
jgi:hypothetical protein